MRIGRRQGQRDGGDAVDALHCVGTSGVVAVVLLLAAVGGPAFASAHSGAGRRHHRSSVAELVEIRRHAAAQMPLRFPGNGHT